MRGIAPPLLCKAFAVRCHPCLVSIPTAANRHQVLRAKVAQVQGTVPSKVYEEYAHDMEAIQKAHVAVQMMIGQDAMAQILWSTFKGLLHKIAAMHYKLPWEAKEKAMDIAGVSAFSTLFGNSFSSAQLHSASQSADKTEAEARD